MMKSSLIASAFVLTFTPALADTASFEQAFTDICLQSLPTMTPAREVFKAKGWTEYQAGVANEFEYSKDTTQVFLITGIPEELPGCIIVDESVSQPEAKQILELALDEYYEGRWKAGTGFNDTPAWRLFLDIGTITFSTEELLGEGGSISFELRLED